MDLSTRRLCLFRRAFFGLTAEHKQYFYEELFSLAYYGKISISEAQRMPIYTRQWFIQRVKKELKELKKKQDQALKGKK